MTHYVCLFWSNFKKWDLLSANGQDTIANRNLLRDRMGMVEALKVGKKMGWVGCDGVGWGGEEKKVL